MHRNATLHPLVRRFNNLLGAVAPDKRAPRAWVDRKAELVETDCRIVASAIRLYLLAQQGLATA